MPQGVPIELEPPVGGVRGDVAPHKIPPGFLWRSLNGVDRFGRLRTRQGLIQAVPTGPGSRITGGMSFRTAADTGLVVAATPTKWYRLGGSSWDDISGAHTFGGSASNPSRFVVFPSSGVNWLIGVNNVDIPLKWDGVSPSIVAVGGPPPDTAKDITTAANYVILGNVVEDGVRSSSRIRVSNFNDLDLWDQYPPADLVQTNDEIVAVRAISRTAFAIYKTRSQWMAVAQLGLFPFRLEVVDWQPGPVSPSAVVAFGGVHYYFGSDLRIYRFDGYQAEPVSLQADYYLQTAGLPTTARALNRDRVFGIVSVVDRSVWFFYPGSSSQDPTLALQLRVDTGAIYPHVFPFPVSAGWDGEDTSELSWVDLLIYPDWVGGAFEATYPSWDSFGGTSSPTCFIGSVAGQVYRQRYDVPDDIYPIPMVWEFPLKTWLGIENHTHIDGLECFFEQTDPDALVRVDIGVSDALAEPADPNYTTLGFHNTGLTTRQKLNIPDLDARFWSIRFGVTSTAPQEFRGGLANGWPEEVPESGDRPEAVIDITPITVEPTTGVTEVTVPGAFASDYMVAIETSWPTQYGIPEATKTTTSFLIELGTPVPPGGVIRCKVITS